MSLLKRLIAPDEPVLWHSPTLREWAISHIKVLAWTAGIPVAVAVLFQSYQLFVGSLVAPLFGLALAAKDLFANPAEVLLTGRQLLFRRRIRRSETGSFERRDIARVEVFGGDGTLVLYGRREELSRLTLLGEPMDLARALDVPTTHWKPYEPTSRLWKFDLHLTLVTILAALGLTSGLVFALPEVFWETVRGSVSDMTPIVAGAMTFGIVAAAGVPSALVVALLFGGLRRLLYPRDELKRMRCYKFNLLWRGKDPTAVATNGPRAALRAARLGFDRLINGPFPDCAGIEPEQYQPGAFPPPEEDGEG